MVWPAITGSGPSNLFTPRSVTIWINVVSVSELFDVFVSGVEDETVAVFVIVEPSGTLSFTRTMISNLALPRVASVLVMKVIVPVPPGCGVVMVKAGPAVFLASTNVVFGG